MVEPLRHRQTKGTGTDMLGLTPPRHTSTLPIPAVRFAQTAVIPGRLRQGALKPFATRYPGKVLYLKCCTQSRACREREGGHFGRLDSVRVRGNEASAIKGGAALGRGHALRYCRNGSNLARRSRQALAGRCRGGPQDRVRRGPRAMMRFERTSLSSCFLSSVRPSLLQTSSRAIEIALTSSGPNACHPKNGPMFIVLFRHKKFRNKSFSRRQRTP